MKIVYYLGLFTGLIANVNLNVCLSKIDYKLILTLYLGEKTAFLEIFCIFINLFIKITTGVNIYNLEESLRIFSIL